MSKVIGIDLGTTNSCVSIMEVMDGKQSVVWLQAFNRIHSQKSIIEWCLK